MVLDELGYRAAILRQKVDDKDGKKKWALLSRSKPHKVLKWFGAQKPSDEAVQKEEKRIQFFKHQGSVVDALRQTVEFDRPTEPRDDPKTVVGVLFVCQGRILLVRRAEGEEDEAYWSIPGGHSKTGVKGMPTDLWGNAKRECKEELGSLPPGTGRATRKHTRTEKKTDKQFVTFVVELPPSGMKWKPQLSAEHDAYMWVNKLQAKKLPIHPGVRSVLDNDSVWAGKFVIPLQIALQRQAQQSLVDFMQDHNQRVRKVNRLASKVFHKMAKDLRFVRLELTEVVHGHSRATPVAGVTGVMRYGNNPELYFDVSVSPREAGRVRVFIRTRKTGFRAGATVPLSRLGDIPGWVLNKLEDAVQQEV
jgi:8-oxo-dGTP pyrophosphatase MutT (NUDIX family)